VRRRLNDYQVVMTIYRIWSEKWKYRVTGWYHSTNWSRCILLLLLGGDSTMSVLKRNLWSLLASSVF